MPEGLPMLMDRAYEGDETGNWCSAWAWFRWFRRSPIASNPGYDRALYKKRNEIERLFEDSKASAESSPGSKARCPLPRFLTFALIVEALVSANTPSNKRRKLPIRGYLVRIRYTPFCPQFAQITVLYRNPSTSRLRSGASICENKRGKGEYPRARLFQKADCCSPAIC